MTLRDVGAGTARSQRTGAETVDASEGEGHHTPAPAVTPGSDGGRSSDGWLRRGLHVIAVALRGAPGPFAAGIAGAALFAGMTVAASAVLGWATDEVILPAIAEGSSETRLLVLAVAAILGVALLKATGVVGRRLGAYVAQYRLQAVHRRLVTRRYLELPISWHRRHSTGQLLSNANADVEAAFFLAAPLPMAVGAALLLAITAVLLVVTDPLLAAVGFAVGPALAFANWYYQRRMRHAATVAQRARADVSEVAHESFDAALVVKTMGREAAETARFRTVAEELRDRLVAVGRMRAFFDPVVEALPNVAILLVLLLGATRVGAGAGALTAGDLVQFAYLFRLVAIPMRVFGWLLGDLPRAVVGWDRVRGVLEAGGELPYGERWPSGPGPASAGLREVGFRHPVSGREDLLGSDRRGDEPPTGRGVASVTFDVPPGRTVAVVGATGSGKSTLAALLVRLHDPDTGVVRFDGGDLRELRRDALRSQAAIVFQDAFLFDDTVRENITLGIDSDDAEVTRAARLAQAHGFVTALEHGYDTIVGERGATLSGGQRQRIALARALIRRPRLLVLDDATSAVDPNVEAEILRGIAEAGASTTTVIVAHRRSSIALADEVVFVENGVVAARGAHERLLRELPSYAALVRAYEDEPSHVDEGFGVAEHGSVVS